jgi:hypothetical protein
VNPICRRPIASSFEHFLALGNTKGRLNVEDNIFPPSTKRYVLNKFTIRFRAVHILPTSLVTMGPSSMLPYTKELELLKEMHGCHKHAHTGCNIWCWIDSDNNHIPLCLNDLQVWATSLVSNQRFSVFLFSFILMPSTCLKSRPDHRSCLYQWLTAQRT